MGELVVFPEPIQSEPDVQALGGAAFLSPSKPAARGKTCPILIFHPFETEGRALNTYVYEAATDFSSYSFIW